MTARNDKDYDFGKVLVLSASTTLTPHQIKKETGSKIARRISRMYHPRVPHEADLVEVVTLASQMRGHHLTGYNTIFYFLSNEAISSGLLLGPHSGSVLCTLEFDHASFYALELALDICQKARSLRRDVERQFASHSELLKTLTDNSVSTVSVANHTRAMKRLSAIYADKLWDDNIQVIEDAFVALWL